LDVEIERFFGTSIERLRNRYLSSHDFRVAGLRGALMPALLDDQNTASERLSTMHALIQPGR
jgi:hypothetical protein